MSKFDGWKKINFFIIFILNDIIDAHAQHDLDKLNINNHTLFRNILP